MDELENMLIAQSSPRKSDVIDVEVRLDTIKKIQQVGGMYSIFLGHDELARPWWGTIQLPKIKSTEELDRVETLMRGLSEGDKVLVTYIDGGIRSICGPIVEGRFYVPEYIE